MELTQHYTKYWMVSAQFCMTLSKFIVMFTISEISIVIATTYI
jgi:hypothetical protein